MIHSIRLFLAILFLLLGCAVAKIFLKDISFESPLWFYYWPVLSALFFTVSGRLFWSFGEGMSARGKNQKRN